MTTESRHLARKALGVAITLMSMATFGADVIVAYYQRTALHIGHATAAGVGLFIGGYLLNPPDAVSIADALLKRLPLVSSLWPGGMRREDPPAQPGVPLPPSVTEKEE
jgi:hypothetical protein